jgi:hypothetical protein
VRVNRKLEAAYLPAVQGAIRIKVRGVISKLKSGGIDAARKYLHDDVMNAPMSAVIRNLYRKVGLRHARLNYSRLMIRKYAQPARELKGFGFNPEWAAFIIDHLRNHLLDKITIEINETTRRALLRVLNAAVINEWSIDQTVDALTDWPYARFQAARIVRTEVNRAANVGATAQESTSEFIQVKFWIAVQDYRTRGRNPKDHANHFALNGTAVDADDVFKDPRNGDLLRYPGDPNASAKSVVNCRCAVAYELKRDQNGEPLRKRKTTVVLYPDKRPKLPTVTI